MQGSWDASALGPPCVLELHELRAADALQLAAALVWCSERPKNRPFLCRDARLIAAARQECFDVLAL
jgi:predicted nucleic acid-binding protein